MVDIITVNSAVPESSTWAMLLIGMAGLGTWHIDESWHPPEMHQPKIVHQGLTVGFGPLPDLDVEPRYHPAAPTGRLPRSVRWLTIGANRRRPHDDSR